MASKKQLNALLPETVEDTVITISATDISDTLPGQTSDQQRKFKFSDVISESEYKAKKFTYYDYDYKERYERKFSLPGYKDATYVQTGVYTYVITASDGTTYQRSYLSYAEFCQRLFPDVEFDCEFKDLVIEKQIDIVQSKVKNVSTEYLSIARCLFDIKEKKCEYGDTFTYGTSVYNIYQFAEEFFGLGKTSVKNMLAIAEKFIANNSTELLPDYTGYSYSQLTELVPVDTKLIKKEFNNEMTIKEIRDKKKSLIGGSSSSKDDNGVIKKKEKIDYCKFDMATLKNPSLWTAEEFIKKHPGKDLKELLEIYLDENAVSSDYYFSGGYGTHKTFEEYVLAMIMFGRYVGKLIECSNDTDTVKWFNNVYYNVESLKRLEFLK